MKFTAFAVSLGLLSSYIYLGLPNNDESKSDDNFFIAHNKRIIAALKESYDVRIFNVSTG
jgi:hypothetical protein